MAPPILVGRGLGTEMPVDELEPLFCLPCEQCVGVAHLGEDPSQCVLLALRMRAPVAGMRDQVLGPDAPELDDAVSDLHKHMLCDPKTYKTRRSVSDLVPGHVEWSLNQAGRPFLYLPLLLIHSPGVRLLPQSRSHR